MTGFLCGAVRCRDATIEVKVGGEAGKLKKTRRGARLVGASPLFLCLGGGLLDGGWDGFLWVRDGDALGGGGCAGETDGAAGVDVEGAVSHRRPNGDDFVGDGAAVWRGEVEVDVTNNLIGVIAGG